MHVHPYRYDSDEEPHHLIGQSLRIKDGNGGWSSATVVGFDVTTGKHSLALEAKKRVSAALGRLEWELVVADEAA